MQQTEATDEEELSALLRRPRRSRPRWRIGLGAAVVLVIAAAVVAVLVAGAQAAGRTRVLPPVGSAAPTVAVSVELLYVHVAGEVEKPGLYLLDPGARVADALAAAGGFTEVADRAAVNLARRLVDGEQLLVPEQGAAPVAGGHRPAAGAGSSASAPRRRLS